MEGYMNDMLMKSMTFEQHLLDLEEVLFVMGLYQMKLNLLKYVFAIK
jgi:hypothetical protein